MSRHALSALGDYVNNSSLHFALTEFAYVPGRHDPEAVAYCHKHPQTPLGAVAMGPDVLFESKQGFLDRFTRELKKVPLCKFCENESRGERVRATYRAIRRRLGLTPRRAWKYANKAHPMRTT